MTDFDSLLADSEPDDPRLAEGLVRGNGAYLERLALGYLGDPDEAEDAAQETLIRAARNLHRYRPGSNLRGWLTVICANVCKGRLRRRKTRQRLLGALQVFGLGSAAAPDPETSAIQNDQNRLLRLAVASLPEGQRLVVLLRYVQGLPVREIAAALEIPEGTVHSRLHHAHQRLRQTITRLSALPVDEAEEEA